MSRWHEEFKNHQLHSRIEHIQNLLTEKAFNKLDIALEQEISRLRKIMELVGNILSSVDHEMVSKAQLDQFNSQFSQVEAQLNSFKSNPQQSYLVQANTYIDASLSPLAKCFIALLSGPACDL